MERRPFRGSAEVTGQQENSTGLGYFQARYYYGIQGRLDSPDPANFGADITDPQDWNGYGYVGNQPLTFVDPDGLQQVYTSGASSGGSGGSYGGGGGVLGEALNLLFNYLHLGWSFGSNTPPVMALQHPLIIQNTPAPPASDKISKAKKAFCSAVPSGRSKSLSLAFGGIGAVSGDVDMVVNYNSGQSTLFATGGGGLGWNGGLSLTVTTGLVYGLDGTDDGACTAAHGRNLSPTPVPFVGAGGSITHGGKVTVFRPARGGPRRSVHFWQYVDKYEAASERGAVHRIFVRGLSGIPVEAFMQLTPHISLPAIVGGCLGASAAILLNIISLIMIGKVNERVPPSGRISYLWWGSNVRRTFRHLYPRNRLVLLHDSCVVLMITSFVIVIRFWVFG